MLQSRVDWDFCERTIAFSITWKVCFVLYGTYGGRPIEWFETVVSGVLAEWEFLALVETENQTASSLPLVSLRVLRNGYD